jgi:glycosyltransferase involved in cell wall biosynthesis
LIHFTITFADDPSDSPLAHALRELGIPHRLIAKRVSLRYRKRIWLILVGLPRLFRVAVGFAWRSLMLEKPRPDVIVVGSHLEAVVFALGRFLLRRRAKICLLGFIYTSRSRPWLDRLRRTYFTCLFGLIDGVFCHSRLEVTRYQEIFSSGAGKFLFLPYGLHIDGFDRHHPFVPAASGPALSAGRSGRDYQLLTNVFSSNGLPLRIVCDRARALEGCSMAPNISVLQDCFDERYLDELRKASVVIVPLSVGDISAGQMVIIQAMAYRKPIIATRTPTVEDYLSHGVDSLLVSPGDRIELQVALDRVYRDPEFAAKIGERAYARYVEAYSMRSFISRIILAIDF